MEIDWQTVTQLGYALGVGTLMGVERAFEENRSDSDVGPDRETETEQPEAEQPEAEPEGEAEHAGVRTFAILSLTGYAAARLGEHFGWIPAVAVASMAALVLLLYWRTSSREGGIGITTEAAAIACGLLGMMCRFEPELAGVMALVITVLLASKRFTHRTAARLRRIELTDTLKFLVVVLIVLPLLPDRALDPWEAFNPHKVGLLVTLISGLSYVGYFLTKILGPRRGLGLTGVLGGLTSSTAVTAAMAQQAKEQPKWRASCAVATIAANATMFVRVLVIVAVLDVALTMRLAWSIGAMAAVAIAATLVLWSRSRGSADEEGASAELALKNPFSLAPALKFGAFFVFILFVVKVATEWLGDQGLYAAAALSGLADVDAITLSISEGVQGGALDRDVAAIAITIAVVSNSITKSSIAIYSGGWAFGRIILACLGGATLLGLLVAVLV